MRKIIPLDLLLCFILSGTISLLPSCSENASPPKKKVVLDNIKPAYSTSELIKGVEFNLPSKKQAAPGSDNWAITWADDDNQYTTWGDGGGFGGTNSKGRVSLGVANISGEWPDYKTQNIWGGFQPVSKASFKGKSYGILCLNSKLYMWRSEERKTKVPNVYGKSTLYMSSDYGRHWKKTKVIFNEAFFPQSYGFFTPTILNFGKNYQGARDDYVYFYAPELKIFRDDWEVQFPGELALFRVKVDQITNRNEYQYFAGKNSSGNPIWTSEVQNRKAVFSDPINGIMRSSVYYNRGLKRYILAAQQVSRYTDYNAHIGIYEAPEPWGPWKTIMLENAVEVGLISHFKTVFFNFSTKWESADGRDFVMVYTNKDNWAAIEGTFKLNR